MSAHLAESLTRLPDPGRPVLGKNRLGFGASALGGRTGRKESLRLLETAYDSGIRYFDTAPMYGYGASEGIVGEFAQNKRSDVTITTKFGIEPPKRSPVMDIARSVARTLITVAPGLRARISKRANAQVQSGNFDLGYLEMSLARSLAALKTCYIDILLMHEISLSAITPDLVRALKSAQSDGRIRFFGLASIEQEMTETKPLPHVPGEVLQMTDRAFRSVTHPPGQVFVTHSIFSGSFRRLLDRVSSDFDFAARCSRELDVDARDNRMLGRLSLFAAMLRNPEGVVLFSSLNPETIRRNAALQESREFSDDQISAFERLLLERAGTPEQ